MKQRLFECIERLRRSYALKFVVVLAVTVSVQGVVVVGQFLVAFAVEPDQLGLIRWLESAFAIALLASSCGMPSVTFREAALSTSPSRRFALIVRAGLVTTLSVGFVLLISIAAYFTFEQVSTSLGWVALIAMAGALWPSNVARIGVAIVQGGQLSEVVWSKLLVFSIAAAGLLFATTWLAGVNGWIFGRYFVEFGLAVLVVHQLSPRQPKLSHVLKHGFHDLRGLFWVGTTANFAFLIRAVSDHLPILLLMATLGKTAELGWYGFASLAIFMPTLLLSVLMQAKLPVLVQSVGNLANFQRNLSDLQLYLLYGAAVGACLIFALSMLIHWKFFFTDYTSSAWPLLILGASLPFRALIMTAGAAAVAHGRYAISSVLAMLEILVVLCFSFSGHANAATEMALAVLVASALSVLPAFALTQSCRRTSKRRDL